MRELPQFDCEDGYPVDAAIDALRNHEFSPGSAARFLVIDLPSIAEQISCMSVRISDATAEFGRGQVKAIEYHTGGWSGAEELINTMLSHFWIRHLHTKWERGGHFYFEVPTLFLSRNLPA